MDIDLRITPFRKGIAAQSLRGRVDAEHFVEGHAGQINVPELALRTQPMLSSGMESQALKGQHITIYTHDNGYSLIQSHDDQYVGWSLTSGLSFEQKPTTHHIKALRTFVYSDESIKSLPLYGLSYGSKIAIAQEGEKFSRLTDGGYIFSDHIRANNVCAQDWVKEAEKFLNCPYLWGGRTSSGLDCSGLVQLALSSQNILAPRDSDQQEAALGKIVAWDKTQKIMVQRGDLLFWKGHVAIATDAQNIIHANAYHMSVQYEKIEEALSRIEASGTPLKSIKRL